MSTTFVTAASTLDASINRLKNIKAQAQIYHNHQIAEAQHLSVEALRVSNDAKLAADRVEAMKKTLSLFHLERRIKHTVQQKEKIQTRLILIAPNVEEKLHVPAAQVRKEDPPTSLVTTAPTTVKEQPKGIVIEEEPTKDNPMKNEPIKEETAVHEVTKNDTIEEQSTQEESIRVDTACEEEVTTEETIEEEAQTEEEITTVDTLVEDIEEFTKDDQPHQLADLIVLLKQYQKKESPEDSTSEKEASSRKKERATTHDKAVTTTESSEEAAATKEDIAIETVIETGRIVKVMETWKVVTQPKGFVALGTTDGGGVDNNRSHNVRPTATVFPSLLSWTAADSDNVVVHEHCWCERV